MTLLQVFMFCYLFPYLSTAVVVAFTTWRAESRSAKELPAYFGVGLLVSVFWPVIWIGAVNKLLSRR